MADTRTYQPSFSAGELSPSLWARVDLKYYHSGVKRAENAFVHPHGGISNRAGLQFCGEVKTSSAFTRLIPFQFNTEQSYILEFGNTYFRVWKNGGIVLSGGSPYEVATPYATAHLQDIVFTQEADVMYVTHPSYAPRKISRLADNSWTVTTVTFSPSISAPSGVSAATGVAGWQDDDHWTNVTYRYKVASIAASGEESLPSGEATAVNNLRYAGNTNIISWTANANAVRYVVYKYYGGTYGYIGSSTGTSFTDENITPDMSDTPQTGNNPFSGSGNYPRCCTFVEQRLAFASTNTQPQAVWLSQSGNYENFGFASPAKASDAVSFRIRARQVNEVRALMPMRGLMLLTSGGEFITSGGSQSDAITPSAIRIEPQGYRGSSRVQPIVVGGTVLFAQDRGCVIRDFSYEFAGDAFTGKDLTIMARHLFEDKNVVSMAYAQAPYSMVWVVLDDGSLVSLTYVKEHEVWAWTRHSSGTGAYFESVSVVAEGNEDVPYFAVRRTIGGATKRYIERLHTRVFSTAAEAFFVDSGLTYSGSPATTISGLGHLEGQSVVALADGNVVRNLTVSSGAVTLPNAASLVHIGLPITTTIWTMNIDLGQVQGLGTVQGRKKTVSKVTFRVEDTRGVFVGIDDGDYGDANLVEWKQRRTEAWGEPIFLRTGVFDVRPTAQWNLGGGIYIKQFDPLPMTILAVMLDITVGE